MIPGAASSGTGRVSPVPSAGGVGLDTPARPHDGPSPTPADGTD